MQIRQVDPRADHSEVRRGASGSPCQGQPRLAEFRG